MIKNTIRKELTQPKDLNVFLTVIRQQSFAAAAEELGQSPAFVSKRIAILESHLGTKLFHRSTKRIALTDDGVRTERWAMRILADINDMIDDLTEAQSVPRGLLHICSSFGFGRKMIAPAMGQLAEKYPELEIRLEVFDRAIDLVQEGFDLEIRIGDDLPQQHICKLLKSNRRILCASPQYLAQFGTPTKLDDLQQHNCMILKERNSPNGVWNLEKDNKSFSIPISGRCASNNGEIILQWGLQGQGIAMRSMWDVEAHIKSGELVQILPDYSQKANIWAVYPTRLSHSAKLRVCVEFLQQYLNL